MAPALKSKPKPNLVDKIVGYFDPGRGLKRIFQRQLLTSYTATKPSRQKRDREKRGGSGDDHLNQSTLWELREIGRELDRNNGMVTGALDRLTQNVLGPEGPGLQSRTDDEALNEQIEADFRDWLANDADISGRHHGQVLFQKIKLSEYRDGDHFVQLDPEGRNGNGSLRWFEGDRVLTPTGVEAVNGMPMINGIAYDPSTGEPRWYFVANDHPADGRCQVEDGKFIRAETVVPFCNVRRLSQGRGQPVLTPSMRDIDDLDDMMLFEKIGSKLVASQGFVVETEDPYGFAEAMRDTSTSDERLEEIEPGSINYMKKGETVKSIQNNRPGNNFEPFTRLISRFIGLPIGMPIELLLLDFSQINFSGSRQLLHLAQQGFRTEQFRTGCQLSRIFSWWLGLQIAKGRYAANPKLGRHEWSFPGWPSPNPREDAQAFEIDLRTRSNSRTNYNRAKGRDWPKTLQELGKEEKAIAAAGVENQPAAPAQKQPAQDQQDPQGGKP